MLAFSRITSLLLFVLSLSFLTCALPTSVGHSNALATRDQGAELLKICADLEVDVKAKVDAIGQWFSVPSHIVGSHSGPS
jgi:hypothetical protein